MYFGHKTQQVRNKKGRGLVSASWKGVVVADLLGSALTPLINVYSPDYLALSHIPACSQWLAPWCLAFRLPTPANNKEAGYGGCSFWRLLIKEMTKPSGQEEGAANA